LRKSLPLLAAMLLLLGCSGGGGGGAVPVSVSGTVRAPNGLIAFPSEKGFLTRFAGRLFPEAHAVVSGIAPVADGVRVELVRLSNTGQPVATLATTVTSSGRYTFNLTSLGLSFSSDLVVRIFNSSTGKQLRAFVTSGQVDVDPMTEASVQMILEKVTGPPAGDLTRFTPREINDLVAGVDLLTTVMESSSGADIDTTVAAVKTAAAADPVVSAYLASASDAGQTLDGTGDVGNFFPVGQGNAWRYHGTSTADGGPPTTYISSIRVTGTTGIGGVTATVFTVVNDDNAGATTDVYFEKNSRGVVDWGTNDPGDPLTPLLVPFTEATFPFRPGTSFVQTDRKGLTFPDIGGDGISETADHLTVTVRMEGLEEVVVPVGTIRHCAKLVTVAAAEVRLSDIPVGVTVTITETRWFAPGVGLVRRHQVTEAAGGGQSFVDTVVEELGGYLADGNGKGVLPESVIAAGVAPGNSDVSTPGKAAIASDGDAYLVVYRRESGGTGTLSATLLSGTGTVTNNIDIATGGANPAAAFDGTNYLVVFGRDGLIYGNRVSPSGTVLDGQGFAISTGTPSVTNHLPAVAFGGGTCLVTWGKFGGSEFDIYGARVTPSATVLDEFPISTAQGEQTFSSVAYGGGNFLVVWRDSRTLADSDVYGARVTPGGVVLDPSGIPVSTATGIQGEPAVAFGGGHFLAAWSDGRNYPGGAQKFDIFAARVDPDGTVLDGPGGIPVNSNPAPIEGKFNASVAFDGASYFVAWQAGSFPIYKPSGIFAARVSTAGALLDGPAAGSGILVAEPGENYTRLYYPSLAARGPNAFLVWSNIAEMSGTSKSISGVLVYP